MSENRFTFAAFILIAVAVTAGLSCYFGMFYQTGAQYYRACWVKAHAQNRDPASPDEAADWSRCSVAADEALYDAGYIQAGNPKFAVTPQLKAIQKACPNAWSDVPISGIWGLIVQMIQDKGGPDFVDRLFPARQVILNTVHSRWPDCPTARVANGFPKMVERQDAWEWETPCVPCESEKKAIADSEEAQRNLDSKSDAEKEAEFQKFLDDIPRSDAPAGPKNEAKH